MPQLVLPRFVLPAPPTPSVAVAGEAARFPVRRVFCVGRNYAAHAREMGKDPDREPPFFFTKPADAVVGADPAAEPGAAIPYPPLTSNLHFEMELVVAIGAEGFEVPAERALDLVWGYAAGLDLTRRDLQEEAKAMGRPWDWGKAFDRSAPLGAIRRADQGGHPARARIWLDLDGRRKQEADVADMIWSVPDVLAHLTRSVRVMPGDLVMTGTPAGVGAVPPGGRLRGGVEGVGEVEVTIA